MEEKTSSKKILIVDDDQLQITLFEGILTEQGYEVVSSTEAAEGLQLAMDIHPEIIILDVMMPVINGYNFCKLLKDQKGKKHIPIILVTSRDEEEDIKIGIEMGANAYLTKPVDTNELLEVIKKVESEAST